MIKLIKEDNKYSFVNYTNKNDVSYTLDDLAEDIAYVLEYIDYYGVHDTLEIDEHLADVIYANLESDDEKELSDFINYVSEFKKDITDLVAIDKLAKIETYYKNNY